MRSIDEKFYSHKAWIDCEKAYKNYVGGLCENCLKQGIYTPGKIVHHKIHLNPTNVNNPAIAYGFDNLQLLCIECHNKVHYGERPKSRYYFDDDGNCIVVDDGSPLSGPK